MSAKYLLPCDCGKKLEVDSTESGLTKACDCGALLIVPKLRGLAKLERVAVSDAAGDAWGSRQRGIAVGAVLAVLGFGFGLYATFFIGLDPREFQAKWNLPPGALGDLSLLPEDAAPADVLHMWQSLERHGLTAGQTDVVEKYLRQRRVRAWWMILGYGAGIVGLAVVGLALAFADGSPSRPRPSGAARPPTSNPRTANPSST